MMRRLAFLAAVTLLAAASADARIQGEKGRRLEIFGDLRAYLDGAVILEEPRVITSHPRQVIQVETVRRFAHQFLETRLRELPWSVRPWHDEFGPVARETASMPTLVFDCTVYFENSVVGHRLMVEIFGRDLDTGRVVARFQGYGSALTGTHVGARDDMQELSRVFTWYLADNLGVEQPAWMGYEPAPFRKRDTRQLSYEMLAVDKNRSIPGAIHHADPPVNEDAREDSRAEPHRARHPPEKP